MQDAPQRSSGLLGSRHQALRDARRSDIACHKDDFGIFSQFGKVALLTGRRLGPTIEDKTPRASLNAELTMLTDEQAKYIGVAKSGPYKTDHYRY